MTGDSIVLGLFLAGLLGPTVGVLVAGLRPRNRPLVEALARSRRH